MQGSEQGVRCGPESAFELPLGVTFRVGEGVRVRGRSRSTRGSIELIDVSFDGGRSWRPAWPVDVPLSGRWSRWEAAWCPEEPGVFELLARATDSAGRAQTKPTWGFAVVLPDAAIAV